MNIIFQWWGLWDRGPKSTARKQGRPALTCYESKQSYSLESATDGGSVYGDRSRAKLGNWRDSYFRVFHNSRLNGD